MMNRQSLKILLKKDFNPDTENIQHTFYNFHYGKIIKAKHLNFLNEQAIEYGFIQKEETPPPPIKNKPSALSFKYINNTGSQENITDLIELIKAFK
jgi:hypothetical protein